MKSNHTLTISLIGAATIMLPNLSEAALVNPGFEDGGGSTTGWTLFGNAALEAWASQGAGSGMAFQGWVNGGSGGFYQDSSVIVGTEYTFSANMHFEPGFNPSTLEIKLEWIGAGTDTPQSLLGFPTGSDASNLAEWNVYSVTGTAPAGATSIRTTLFFAGTSDIGGLQAARVDNLSLTSVPEPSATALLGLGGLALILRRRK